MTTTYSTDSGISLTTNLHAVKQMLEHAEPHIVLDKFAKQVPMPKNVKTTIQFRRPVPFDAATAPLTEGVSPTPRIFSYVTVNATIKQYGETIEVTDWIEDTSEDPVLQDATEICGENLGRTREALLYGVVKAGTSVSYSNGSARNAVNTVISLNGIRGVVRSLRSAKARQITKVLSASVNIGTTAVEAGYVAVCHSDVAADIRNMTGFTPVAEYGSMKTVHSMELGKVEDVRFVCSADLGSFADAGGAKGAMKSTTGTSADVYPVLIFGQNSFAAVSLKGMHAVSAHIVPVGQSTKSDPLAQVGYVGWKTGFTGIILNQAWIERYEVAVTSL